jgi:hypothetical protein
MKLAMGLLIAAGVEPWATPARATLVQMCNWGTPGAAGPEAGWRVFRVAYSGL